MTIQQTTFSGSGVSVQLTLTSYPCVPLAGSTAL